MSQIPRVSLFLRITPELSTRIEAACKASDPAHPWRVPTKQDFVVGVLESAVAGKPPKNDRQLDIEDVINGKAKARKVTRKPARAKVAKRSKARKARKTVRA